MCWGVGVGGGVLGGRSGRAVEGLGSTEQGVGGSGQGTGGHKRVMKYEYMPIHQQSKLLVTARATYRNS